MPGHAGSQAAHDRAQSRTLRLARHRGSRRFLPGIAAVERVARVQVGEMQPRRMANLSAIFACMRHQLADFHPGHIGADRAEFAAVFAERRGFMSYMSRCDGPPLRES